MTVGLDNSAEAVTLWCTCSPFDMLRGLGWGYPPRHFFPNRHAKGPGGAIWFASRHAQRVSERNRAMGKRTTKAAGIGSTLDDLLKDDGTYEATKAVAIKRVPAWQGNFGPSSTSSARMRG